MLSFLRFQPGVSVKKIVLSVVLVAATCALAVGQTYKVLYSFGGDTSDGTYPVGNLMFDSAGNLYGTTTDGGANSFGGIVFQLSPQSDGTWSEIVLYNFCATYRYLLYCSDGEQPVAGLTFDAAGNLYGTTVLGGKPCWEFYGTCGTVFKLAPPQPPATTWTETVLYAFCDTYDFCYDGAVPMSQLVFDSAGNLYGTAREGGASVYQGGLGIAAGDVFELSPTSNGFWTETALYSFNEFQGAPEAGVIFDASGNLYGTTEFGPGPSGTVFEVSPSSTGWTGQRLANFSYNFCSTAPLASDNNGNFYGTSYGIDAATGSRVFGFNVQTQTKRSRAISNAAGSQSLSGVLIDAKHGSLYGTAYAGGANNGGTVWEVSHGAQPVAIYSFCAQSNCTDGMSPTGGLIEDQSGNLYGVTFSGGTYNKGVVFEITP
jgi:uncharacterized repeat protein (TIGR03803 family)